MTEPPTQLTPERATRLRAYCALLRRTGQAAIADEIEAILYAPIVAWEDR